ncbi:hypothetical protein OsJ_09319 [Oryza sativa Japonica Group]|uniref:Uncharacterized protein n=1 Tax=Oryza sativa subsp. japonica TaxID=39947 RepID=B9FAY6_ORYSJ|nr:hypothetical protein OsJ_09319 [Oryza sativa Japonica Group]
MDDDDAARVKLGGGAMMTAEGVGGAAADCHRSAPPISRTATPPDSRLRSPPPTRLHWFAPPGVDPPIRQGWAAGPAMARAAPPPTLLGPSYHHILTTLGTKMSSRITKGDGGRLLQLYKVLSVDRGVGDNDLKKADETLVEDEADEGWAAGPAMARAAPTPTLLGPSYHHILTTLGTKMSSRITSEQPNRRSHKPHASDASFPLTWIGATPSIRLRGFPLQPSPSRPDADAVTPARR